MVGRGWAKVFSCVEEDGKDEGEFWARGWGVRAEMRKEMLDGEKMSDVDLDDDGDDGDDECWERANGLVCCELYRVKSRCSHCQRLAVTFLRKISTPHKCHMVGAQRTTRSAHAFRSFTFYNHIDKENKFQFANQYISTVLLKLKKQSATALSKFTRSKRKLKLFHRCKQRP